MKSFALALALVAVITVGILAEPEPAKGLRYRAAQIIDDDSEVAIDDNSDDNLSDVVVEDGSKSGDASSGRLFMKKFLLFKNMFGSNQKQPIIPIIITGGNTGTTAPTTTVTSTGTVPSGTGTITTSPTTNTPGQRVQLLAARGTYDNNDQEEELPVPMDEQSLVAALGAGAEEYVVTDQEIKGTSGASPTKAPARINLKRRGVNNGQVVSVRIPPRYRGYFKNGQRVILNNANRPAIRRVIKKRVVRNRNKNNNNNRRRVIG